MKKMLLAVFVVLFAWATQSGAVEGYHTFTFSNGRMLAARILEYNPNNNQLQIERLDGKKAWVGFSAFSEKDHTYIREWIEASKILSEFHLKVTLEKIVHSQNKHKEYFCYEIKLENHTGRALDDLKIEYKYFVDLESGTVEAVDPKRVIHGQLHVDHMDDESWKRLRIANARSFEAYPYQSEKKSYDDRGKQIEPLHPQMTGKCEVKGLWVRIHGPMVDGVPTYRDVFEPESFAGLVDWDEERMPINEDFSFDNMKPSAKDKNIMPLEEVKKRGKAADTKEFKEWMGVVRKQFEQELSNEEMHVLVDGVRFFYSSEFDASGSDAAYMGSMCKRNGLWEDAVAWYETALEKYDGVRRSLTYIYACAKDPELRNGPKAVEYAQVLLEDNEKDPRLQDLLARAYAANNQFVLAVKTQKFAIERYRRTSGGSRQAATSSELAGLKERLKLYEAGQLYIESDEELKWR